MKNFKPYVWIDIETTGLTDDNLNILEIGIVITNKKCKRIGQPIRLLVNYPQYVYDNMSEWAKKHHYYLVTECKSMGSSLEEVGYILENLFKKLTGITNEDELVDCKRKITLCGSSVWNDRRILLKSFPFLEKYLYHQILDVSSILMAIKMFNYNALIDKPKNTSNHTAIDDINSSIDLMLYIGIKFFIKNV